MFNHFFGSVGVPAVAWLCLGMLVAAMEPPYTVYRGTFIHLPRLDSNTAKPELARNEGALWVSAADGRIKGYDWNVHDDASFKAFMSRHGWSNAGAGTNRNSKTIAVKVVQSSDTQNEFFFPGFIGISHLPSGLSPINLGDYLLNKPCRHSHPRTAVSQHWAVRIIRPSRLAR